MGRRIPFKISTGLKNIIGRDLITDDLIAIFELVKNSYDAYAKEVKLIFEEDRILVIDDGKGMNYDDIINKWLFVAYSAKKHRIEDQNLSSKTFSDYRNTIKPKSYYAGAKGVGRFSCDRLGSKLNLISKSAAKGAKIEQIIVNWDDFEKNAKEEFENVKVFYENPDSVEYSTLKHGTILEITGLRSQWTHARLKELKHSLEKLINPFESITNSKNNNPPFSIYIIAKNELEADKKAKLERDKINGPVKNFIFETINIKTTQILTSISKDGRKINTQLIDRGVLIYEISENNLFKVNNNKKSIALPDIKLQLFYLNQTAKTNFHKLMGIASHKFGSVFLYRNGFRVQPYGEPGEDIFNIDSRKAQGHFRFLGTRDLLGRIEITDDKELFKETSSRDGGLVKNEAYDHLTDLFIEKCLLRLENYVVNIQWALRDKGEELDKISSIEGKEKIIDLISSLTASEDIELVKYNKDFLDIIRGKLVDTTLAAFENLKSIAKKSKDQKFFSQIVQAEKKYKLQKAEKRKIEAKLDEITTENLFLKSLKTKEYDELLTLHHQIGISAETVSGYLGIMNKKLVDGQDIPKENLISYTQKMSFENSKILTITKFATRANFRIDAITTEGDVVKYISEYLTNIVKSALTINRTDINIYKEKALIFICKYRPIELLIIVDNLISNSRKAKATIIEIYFHLLDRTTLEIIFRDNGEGIEKDAVPKIYDFGFTTTKGSGLGLFHVKNIVKKMGWEINFNEKYKKGAEFILKIKK